MKLHVGGAPETRIPQIVALLYPLFNTHTPFTVGRLLIGAIHAMITIEVMLPHGSWLH